MDFCLDHTTTAITATTTTNTLLLWCATLIFSIQFAIVLYSGPDNSLWVSGLISPFCATDIKRMFGTFGKVRSVTGDPSYHE